MTRFASVVLFDRHGRLLLQERDEHPVIDPGKWGFVGGHVEAGEGFEAAAYRELEEETGIRLDDGLQLFGRFTVHHDQTGTDDEVRVFTRQLPDLTDADVECREGRRIVFVDPIEARRLDLTAAARVVLPLLLDSR